MSVLTTETKYSEELFEFLWCPVCGNHTFRHIVFQGVYCQNCNTAVQIGYRRQSGDDEYTIHIVFNTESTKGLHSEPDRRPIPGEHATLLVQETPAGYSVDTWFSDDSDWAPVEEAGFAGSGTPTPAESRA